MATEVLPLIEPAVLEGEMDAPSPRDASPEDSLVGSATLATIAFAKCLASRHAESGLGQTQLFGHRPQIDADEVGLVDEHLLAAERELHKQRLEEDAQQVR